MVERPERAGIVLKRLYAERPIKIWPFAPTILKFLPNTLDSNVSRYIQGKLLLIIVNLRRKMSLSGRVVLGCRSNVHQTPVYIIPVKSALHKLKKE